MFSSKGQAKETTAEGKNEGKVKKDLPPLPSGFEEPPVIPAKGVFVPKSTQLYASRIRKQKREEPASLPYRLFIWLAEYEEAHPFGFAKQDQMEDEWQKVNEERGVEIEEAKGNKTYRIIEAEAKRDEVHTKIYDAAFDKLKEAVELGAKLTKDAIKTEIKGLDKSNAALVGTVEKQSGLIEKMFAEKEAIFDDRLKLLELMRDAEEGRPIDPVEVKSRWSSIWGITKKAAQLFAPTLKNMGFDIEPFLLEDEKTKPEEAQDSEEEEEETDEPEEKQTAPKQPKKQEAKPAQAKK